MPLLDQGHGRVEAVPADGETKNPLLLAEKAPVTTNWTPCTFWYVTGATDTLVAKAAVENATMSSMGTRTHKGGR